MYSDRIVAAVEVRNGFCRKINPSNVSELMRNCVLIGHFRRETPAFKLNKN